MKPSTKIENRFYIQQYHYLYNEIQFIYYENIYMDTACILLTFICFFMHATHHTSITWMRLQEVTKTTEPHLALPGKV